ncbi:MAG TPA: hypothetical protein VME67_12850, partial [Mycobacterium sp.]|nr:hypothetical protein [Mycobacterium sp.]
MAAALLGSVTTASRDFQEAVGRVLGRAQAAGVARSDATVDDVLVPTSALARVSAPDKNEAVDRLTEAIEGAEDAFDPDDFADLSAADALVGITASGRTPYVLGALAHARAAG